LFWDIDVGDTKIVYIWGTLDEYENNPRDPFWDTFERDEELSCK